MSAQPPGRDDPGSFRLRLRATPSSLALFREALRDWLLRLELENGDVFDVVLACSEALTLVVEDRPRQVALVVEVVGAFDGDRIVVTTRDYGLWDEAHALETGAPAGPRPAWTAVLKGQRRLLRRRRAVIDYCRERELRAQPDPDRHRPLLPALHRALDREPE